MLQWVDRLGHTSKVPYILHLPEGSNTALIDFYGALVYLCMPLISDELTEQNFALLKVLLLGKIRTVLPLCTKL